MIRKSNESKTIVKRFRVTKEQDDLLLRMTLLSGCSNFSDYVLKRLLDPEQKMLTDFTDVLVGINQNLICIQRQIYIALNLGYQILLELSKFGKFPEEALEINKQVIKEYLEKAKVDAEDTYQSEAGGNQK